MSTATTKTLTLPSFRYKGSDVPALEIAENLINDLDTRKSAYELAPKSVPLVWRTVLYDIGMGLAIGDNDTLLQALPETVKEAGKLVYSDCQERKYRGVWHKDGVLFEPGETIKGTTRPGDDYIVGRYFVDIDGFEQKNGVWRVKTLPETREERIWLPYGDGRFIVPTKDGTHNPLTGTPFETVETEKEAVERWVKAGLTEEQAERELSRHYRKSSGTAAVVSWSYGNDGPLCVSLTTSRVAGTARNGSFAASRVSAERSEAAPRNSERARL